MVDRPAIVAVMPLMDEARFAPILAMLEGITIRLRSEKAQTTRRGFGTHRATTFGSVRLRRGARVALSRESKKHPAVCEALFALGHELTPDFPFTSVHVNKNVQCPPHKDGRNIGRSMIVSFGSYAGCELVVEGTQYDTRHTPHIFDGSSHKHWNNPTLNGTKYSLVYYTTPIHIAKEAKANPAKSGI
jgi:hypothetical protein